MKDFIQRYQILLTVALTLPTLAFAQDKIQNAEEEKPSEAQESDND